MINHRILQHYLLPDEIEAMHAAALNTGNGVQGGLSKDPSRDISNQIQNIICYGHPYTYKLNGDWTNAVGITFNAANIGYIISRRSPYSDGNKRTAFMQMYAYMLTCHYFLELEYVEAANMMSMSAAGKVNAVDLYNFIFPYVIRIDGVKESIPEIEIINKELS